jgi:Xaa-Pro aminopeptidase
MSYVMTRFEQRRKKLARAAGQLGTDAILVTDFTNVTYLTGFTGDDSYLLVGENLAVLLTDPRYTQQAGEECPGLDLAVRRPGDHLVGLLAKVLQRARINTLAVEAMAMTLHLRDRIQAAVPRISLLPCSGLVEQLREVKDKEEVAEIREAIGLSEQAFRVIRAALRPEQTEREIAYELEHQIRRFGGAGCGFPPIVAVGPRAALPHAVPTEQPVSAGDLLLIDWGATARLYCSDLTRLLVTSRISPKLERIYGVVLTAQERAIAAIRPGALMSEVDAAARDVIVKAGYGKYFGHGLGHGFGLQIHEAPRLAAHQDRPLKAGMVVTVEPGIYLPQWGGVRIEDDILVTRDGHEVLSQLPKALDECIVP